MLPDTMHELLALAIADAEKLDRRKYRPDSSKWHAPDSKLECSGDPISSGFCEVCLAGAVIAGTLKCDPVDNMYPSQYDEEGYREKLTALDAMRTGSFILAYDFFYEKDASKEVMSEKLSNGLVDLECKELVTDRDFRGWDKLASHLESMKKVVPELKRLGV